VRTAGLELTAVAVLLASAAAHATPSARLVYSRARGAEPCPDEDALRQAVRARVGYDPFFAWAKKTIVASMAAAVPRGFVATVNLIDEQGMEHGARVLRTEGECGELREAAALAIAIAIDPRSLMPRPAAPEPAPKESTPPPVRPASPPAEKASPERFARRSAGRSAPVSLIWEISAGAVASAGVTPQPAAGLELGAALGWRGLSFGIEGHVDAPASVRAVGGGVISSWLAAAALLSCWRGGSLILCSVVQAGSIQTESEGVSNPRTQSILWLAAGGRFGVLVPLQSDAALRLRSDVVANLAPATLQLNTQDQWTQSPVAGSLGADVVFYFQ
jgi:hypothetical protein